MREKEERIRKKEKIKERKKKESVPAKVLGEPPIPPCPAAEHKLPLYFPPPVPVPNLFAVFKKIKKYIKKLINKRKEHYLQRKKKKKYILPVTIFAIPSADISALVPTITWPILEEISIFAAEICDKSLSSKRGQFESTIVFVETSFPFPESCIVAPDELREDVVVRVAVS